MPFSKNSASYVALALTFLVSVMFGRGPTTSTSTPRGSASGAAIVTYNLQGVDQTLRFSPDVLADIFLGKIKRWNDPRIKADNPGVNLPATDITAVHRSDGSGTSAIFTDYLSKVSSAWKEQVGTGTSLKWPVGSIVVGVFVCPLVVLPTKQFSALAGGIALRLIMLPMVARTTEEMIRLVPIGLREAALALGALQWKVITGVVLPAAISGIATGAMLAAARVTGETAPLLFTALNYKFFSYQLDQPIASLTVQIYNYAISPYDEWHAQAWAATLVLMLIILTINMVVRFFTRKKF